MAERKLICDGDRIKSVNILKSGEVSPKGQMDVTDEVVKVILEHIVTMEDFAKKGVAGYRIPTSDGGAAWLCVFDESLYELKRKEGTEGMSVIDTPEPIPKKKRGARRKTDFVGETPVEIPKKRGRKKKAEVDK